MSALLEIACFNPEAAMVAAQAGAHRIELCSDYSQGGITPLLSDFQRIKREINIPVFIMIRSRGGNFTYSDEEFSEMKSSISDFKSAGADGFVFGILTSDNTIDIKRNTELIQWANLPCTLHRSFDEISDAETALQQTIQCGFTRILTSGGKGRAENNLSALKHLVGKSDNRITILVAGGVRSTNAKKIMLETGCREIHSSALLGKTEIAYINEIKNLLNAATSSLENNE